MKTYGILYSNTSEQMWPLCNKNGSIVQFVDYNHAHEYLMNDIGILANSDFVSIIELKNVNK